MSEAAHDDGSLLKQFVATGNETPFEEVVARHGALVFGVCCRVLGQTQDAEDATQAVFLTLANKAKSLRGYR
jgi:DNA-directed RNA polymerase specialized sigma24 family protein